MDESDTVTFNRMDEPDDEVASQTSEPSEINAQIAHQNNLMSQMVDTMKSMQSQMSEFDSKLTGLQNKVEKIKNKNHQIVEESESRERISCEIDRNEESPLQRRGRCMSSPIHDTFGSSMKLKPHTFNGNEDLDEYLTQFEVLADLNGWSYRTKSLCLSSSLVGEARSLLTELTSDQRRDYSSLVAVLQNRYGTYDREYWSNDSFFYHYCFSCYVFKLCS